MRATRTALFLLSAVLPACLDASPPPEVGQTTEAVNVPVVWQNVSTNVTVTGAGNSLKKKSNGGTAWNGGAASQQTIGGHGFVRFSTAEKDKAKVVGLSEGLGSGDTDYTRADIDYGILLTDDNKVTIWENGVVPGTAGIGTYLEGDVFYIEATPTKIMYQRDVNGTRTTFYTTTVTAGVPFPLRVDASLYSPSATINNVAVNPYPVVHVATQNHLLDPNLSRRCGVDDVLSIGGSHFVEIDLPPEQEPTEQDYIDFGNTSITTIKNHLETYQSNQGIPSSFAGTIVMDIEHPHPMDLGERTLVEKNAIINGYKRRIIATRLAFPNTNLKLGLYGTLVPGHPNYASAYSALLETTDEIQHPDWLLFDATVTDDNGQTAKGVDYLIPILYTRFGCDGPSNCDSQFGTVEGDTITGITDSRDIKRSDGTNILLLPLMSFWVANGGAGTSFEKDALLTFDISTDQDRFPGTLSLQMAKFAEYNVDQVAIWKGGYIPNPNVLTIDDIVRDGDDSQMCWNAAHDDVVVCAGSTDYVRIDDYTCWMSPVL